MCCSDRVNKSAVQLKYISRSQQALSPWADEETG